MKKYLIIIFLIGIIFWTCVVNARSNTILNNKIIVIDPGHGGVDPGTIYNDLYEKTINLKISQILKSLLEKENAKVIMTRNGDYDLSYPNAMHRKKSDFDNRIFIINNSNADLYISIHLNYLNDSHYYGPQVFYQDNEKLADIMQKRLNEVSNSNRSIKTIPDNVYMYKKLNINGLLIECGFISNNEDRKRLTDYAYQLKFAKTVVESLKIYFTQFD
ncbi:MAG: N-acetylmuramoyl-L-alanine amidase [Bacilli bacterium]|nr:N-acetylmuramoyl-L-alanine amidase [Bacilli bacterium]